MVTEVRANCVYSLYEKVVGKSTQEAQSQTLIVMDGLIGPPENACPIEAAAIDPVANLDDSVIEKIVGDSPIEKSSQSIVIMDGPIEPIEIISPIEKPDTQSRTNFDHSQSEIVIEVCPKKTLNDIDDPNKSMKNTAINEGEINELREDLLRLQNRIGRWHAKNYWRNKNYARCPLLKFKL